MTLTFHIALLRFEYAEERKAPGLHWSAELRRALGAMAAWRERSGRAL